jgi:hypothetical protein
MTMQGPLTVAHLRQEAMTTVAKEFTATTNIVSECYVAFLDYTYHKLWSWDLLSL